jgi:hypothetical protein
MNFTPPDLVMVVMLDFQGVVQLQYDGPSSDVQDSVPIIGVAAHVSVFYVVVSVIRQHNDRHDKK